ncbi:TetR/AcrR family transcriptional regulator [Nocardia sp. XZ_19_385]|uniref:TetR/AcrR family transcriptional regulator n=1 Tax=Nocardia sp. XZ_19_385 TaxID=2769488 RepID=UPI00188ED782|nr:TetR/AcrR family transcriptional regulator [Nocardia sp. XZ_19_385]
MTQRTSAEERAAAVQAARRGALVASARALILARGYHGVSAADIAEHAGLSHGSFYTYFGSRREILDAVFDDWFREFRDYALAGLADRPAPTLDAAVEAIAHVVRRLLELARNDSELVLFLAFKAAAIDAEVAQRLSDNYGRSVAHADIFLRLGIAHGYFRDDLDIPTAAELLASIALATVLGQLQGLYPPDADPVVAVCDFVRFALAARM